MKKSFLLFLCLIFLASCDNIAKVNPIVSTGNLLSGFALSGNILSSGATMSGDILTNQLPKEFIVNVEKSYFYDSAESMTPRKGYVMKNDTVSVDNSRNTENMIYAIYTNASGWKTEGYLKKSDLVVKNSEDSDVKNENIKVSHCKRIYDFSVWENQNIKGHRQFEFNFIGDCAEQKGAIEVGALHLSQEWIKVNTGQKWYFMNWMHTFDTWFPGWCWVMNSDFGETFLKWNFFISIKAGKNYCTSMEGGYEPENTYGIDIEISEKWKWKLFDVNFREMPKNVLEQNYNDLLWTLKNGFFEVGKSRNDSILPSEKWTKETLGEWEVSEYSNYINFKDFTLLTGVDKTLGPDCEYRTATRDSNMCMVDEIKNGFVYWSQGFRSYITYQEYEREYTTETKYKTSINTGKTEKINTEEKETCWWEWWMAEGKEIPCK